jgi:hypothetical protein
MGTLNKPGFIRDLEKLWNLKIGQKVMENREILKKTWKSHGICHPVKKLKMYKLNNKLFRKTACGAFPLIFPDVLHIAYFISIPFINLTDF